MPTLRVGLCVSNKMKREKDEQPERDGLQNGIDKDNKNGSNAATKSLRINKWKMKTEAINVDSRLI